MKKTVCLFASVLALNSVSALAAEDKITYFCSQSGANLQHVVEVGEVISVQVHDGPFMLMQRPSDLQLSQNYLRSQLDKVDLPTECKEYLLSQAGFTTYADGDLIARVYFNFNKSDLTKASIHILDQLEQDLKMSQTDLLVEGHTDSIGSEAYNMQLGLKRANAVEQYLEELGADQSQLVLSSQGELLPIATNETDEGRAQNRRVDLSKIAN
ncbi:OmpA family protein [Vibrio ulleungensis]|uniref:OmpA family protein n=1 Tax=Vibrio ulleungensis TaxID=2807619 RepID=A0ABS2HP26_9VIBR|nr:OmpA family protein [Vibrio ulleungensis]MBM7038392.1 OmpA family protein [Vibrio ulleungensis]